MRRAFLLSTFFAVWLVSIDTFAQATKLVPGSSFEADLSPGAAHSYDLQLKRGGYAKVLVHQKGSDLVVRVSEPSGKVLEEIDSPTGRSGTEVVEIFAQESGNFAIQVRPLSEQEPAAKYRLEVTAVLGTRATAELLASRRKLRDAATEWLKMRGTRIGSSDNFHRDLGPLNGLAQRVQVFGLGEATHGSRELNDARSLLTQWLVEQHGYRVIALEGSVDRLRLLEPYVSGHSALTPELQRLLASGIWIGMRSRRELMEWVRSWNLRNSKDPVRIVGVDPQDVITTRRTLGNFLAKAYGDDVLRRWQPAERELAAADEQSLVFGDSSVNPSARELLAEIVAMLDLDSPFLKQRHGEKEVGAAREAARELLEFADFNGGGGVISHSRDWYMGVRVLEALSHAGSSARAVYWGHNAHVAHPAGSIRTTGAVLRSALGCKYGALALTFGDGTVLAQIPNDPEDRLAASSLPPPPEESVESVLAGIHQAGAIAAWDCDIDLASAPEWLRLPRSMHWVGGLYAPSRAPSSAFRPFNLLRDFDGVGYIRRTTAEEIPRNRPFIPARKK